MHRHPKIVVAVQHEGSTVANKGEIISEREEKICNWRDKCFSNMKKIGQKVSARFVVLGINDLMIACGISLFNFNLNW